MVGRRLSEAEIQSYDVCPAELAGRVRVIQLPFLPGGYAGMTMGRTVFLARKVSAAGDSSLLAHTSWCTSASGPIRERSTSPAGT